MVQTDILTAREQEIVDFWKNDGKHYLISGSIILVLVGIIIGGFIFGAEQPFFTNNENFLGYSTNIFTELLSVGITILVLDRLNENREISRLKKRLKVLAKSRNNAVAVGAIDEMRSHNWLEDKLLEAVDLEMANLQHANLSEINLQKTNLELANLENADLTGANLNGANLKEASLLNAILQDTNFENANFSEANLNGAFMIRANLQSAYLWQANLSGANLMGTNMKNANLENASLQALSMIGVDLENAILLRANLEGTNLATANLCCADLRLANMEDTYLGEADLRGANLKQAKLRGAILASTETGNSKVFQAKFDENTILPNGKKYDLEQNIEQLARFGAIVEPVKDKRILQQWHDIDDNQ